MATIYLIRHAEPDFNVHNDKERPLTRSGKESCKKVSDYLKDKEIDAIYSSPYVRALDTIRPFAKEQSIPIILENDFRERSMGGEWIDDFKTFAEKQWEDFQHKLKDGECLAEVQNRTIAALEKILNDRDNIVISSHGTAICTMINYYDKNFGIKNFWEIIDLMPFAVKMVFGGTECISIELLDILDEEPKLVYSYQG
jgi:2,3-bisphosphoglycerate-dependent phosphoglycerate mutase